MNERVLIVDDDELVRTGLAINLEREGYIVLSAASGEEALEMAGLHAIDAVLCDYILGGIDGIQVLKRLQARSPGIAVIMITGQGSVSNAMEALRHGASDYIQKPATPEEVVHRVRTVLDSAHLRLTLSTEHRRAEERKRLLHEQLIRAERMVSLGTLAEGTASDLTSILQPILKHATAIKAALAGNNKTLHLMQEIEDAGEKAFAVLRDLQAIGSESKSVKKRVSINGVVDHFMKSEEFSRLKISNPKVRVDVRIGTNMPLLAGSEEQLHKVVSILVTNAYQTMPGGGIVTLETICEHVERPVSRYGSGPPGDYVILAVGDTGSGMQPEDIERVFEPFYTRKVMGHHLLSGLSLTLVYRVVQDHGGIIDVETGRGKGTKFVISLPVMPASSPDISEEASDFTGQETILVVDDYEEQRKTATKLLESLGYHVLAAKNGHAAVEHFQRVESTPGKKHVDLVVIDLVLGDEFDGVETYKKIIEIRPGQKAILVSGFADITRIVEARKLGIHTCIRKPYTALTLGRAIRQELENI